MIDTIAAAGRHKKYRDNNLFSSSKIFFRLAELKHKLFYFRVLSKMLTHFWS